MGELNQSIKAKEHENRQHAAELLEDAASAQTMMWDALNQIENMYGVDIDSTQDLSDVDLDELIGREE
jgi:hypothetical protein